jgi:20S proteasome alpha/beta subunit
MSPPRPRLPLPGCPPIRRPAVPPLHPIPRQPQPRRDPIHPLHQRPLLPKRKPLYPSQEDMTICIAAICRAYGNDVVVLCSDNRLDQGDLGAQEAGAKLAKLGWNWAAMMAGDWDTVRELVPAMKKAFVRNGIVKTKSALIRMTQRAATAFATSVLCPQSVRCELLITGFIDDEPIMLLVWIDDKVAWTKLVHDFYAIGEGHAAALYILKHRKQNPLRSTLEETVYHVYEAKKFSEIIKTVGQTTRLAIHSALSEQQATQDKWKLALFTLTAKGETRLEECRLRFGLQPINIEPFPGDCFD